MHTRHKRIVYFSDLTVKDAFKIYAGYRAWKWTLGVTGGAFAGAFDKPLRRLSDKLLLKIEELQIKNERLKKRMNEDEAL